MKNDKFEIQFPLLTNNEYKFIDKETDSFGYVEKQIQKCCLDKQKVRDIINEFEHTLIKTLKWDNQESYSHRCMLGIKFDILRDNLGI